MLDIYCETHVSRKAGEDSPIREYYLYSGLRGEGGTLYYSAKDIAQHLNRTAAALRSQGHIANQGIRLNDGTFNAEGKFIPSGRSLQILDDKVVVRGETSRDNYLLELQEEFMKTTR